MESGYYIFHYQAAQDNKTTRQHDSIMVVVDKLTEGTHFILVMMIHKTTNIPKIYIKSIFRLYGVPKTIIFDRYKKFTSNFWKKIFKGFGTNMNFNTMYHLELDGRT